MATRSSLPTAPSSTAPPPSCRPTAPSARPSSSTARAARTGPTGAPLQRCCCPAVRCRARAGAGGVSFPAHAPAARCTVDNPRCSMLMLPPVPLPPPPALFLPAGPTCSSRRSRPCGRQTRRRRRSRRARARAPFHSFIPPLIADHGSSITAVYGVLCCLHNLREGRRPAVRPGTGGWASEGRGARAYLGGKTEGGSGEVNW